MVGLVYRAPEYSLGENETKDAAILNAVGEALEKRGFEIQYMQEDDVLNPEALKGLDGCISMARRREALKVLRHKSRLKVHNSPRSVAMTTMSRSATLALLNKMGLPVAPFWSYAASEDEKFQCDAELQNYLPGWVKVMRWNGVKPGDVSKVDTPLEAETRIAQLAAEDYIDIIVARHLEGALQKVYVVGNQCWPPCECSEIALSVGEMLELDIYGVDFIVTAEGPFIIDVNDFPSFSSCGEEAAKAIADLI